MRNTDTRSPLGAIPVTGLNLSGRGVAFEHRKCKKNEIAFFKRPTDEAYLVRHETMGSRDSHLIHQLTF